MTPFREIRQILGTQIRKGSTSERMEKILALLIESGFVYCLLWVNPVPPFRSTTCSQLNPVFVAVDLLDERI